MHDHTHGYFRGSATKKAQTRLSPRQLRFTQEYPVDNNATQAAIRAGYSLKGARVTGYRLLTNRAIRKAIQAIQEKCAEDARLTLIQHLTDLGQLRDESLAAGEYMAAVQAEISRGGAAGFYSERMERI